jgi:hypothetical protein
MELPTTRKIVCAATETLRLCFIPELIDNSPKCISTLRVDLYHHVLTQGTLWDLPVLVQHVLRSQNPIRDTCDALPCNAFVLQYSFLSSQRHKECTRCRFFVSVHARPSYDKIISYGATAISQGVDQTVLHCNSWTNDLRERVTSIETQRVEGHRASGPSRTLTTSSHTS